MIPTKYDELQIRGLYSNVLARRFFRHFKDLSKCE